MSIYETLTVAEAARLWSLDESTIRKALTGGRLQGRQSGATHLVSIQEMRRVYGVPTRDIDGVEYALLGAGDYGQRLAAALEARFGGHYVIEDDVFYYHNDAGDYGCLVVSVE